MFYSEPILLQAFFNDPSTINFLLLGAMMAVFWLFIIRPQSKKQKEQSSFVSDLEKGDQVVTASGILGKITKIEEEIITLEVSSRVYLRVTKNAISKEMTDTVYVPA